MTLTTRVLPKAATPEEAFDRLIQVLEKGSIDETNVTTLAKRFYSQEGDPTGFNALVKRLRGEVRKSDGVIRGVECSGCGRFSLRR